MKNWFRLTGFNLLFLCTFSSIAASWDSLQDEQRQTKEQTRALVKYLLNLGSYLGYDLKKEPPPATQVPFSSTLIDLGNIQKLQYYTLNTFLGAIPVNAVSATLAQFLPNNLPGANLINIYANTTFARPPYETPALQQGSLSVNPVIDQKEYQKDPISQAVLNILTTPSYTVCMNLKPGPNQPLCQNRILSQVIGEIPSPSEFYSYPYNEKLIPQLNINALLSPLLYSSENSSGTGSSSGAPDANNKGLTAQTQTQQAANFIRYASGSVTPLTLPTTDSYEKLYNKATERDPLGGGPTVEKLNAQNTLNNYLASLRVYAAQSSIGLSNMYYILSKRIPQNQGATGNANTLSSQALSEYNMATWRLKPADPNKQNEKTWVDRINTGSAATVQKEMAILLSEINYQLYLNRQQEERLLLTQSMLLLQNTKAAQPALPTQGSGKAFE